MSVVFTDVQAPLGDVIRPKLAFLLIRATFAGYISHLRGLVALRIFFSYFIENMAVSRCRFREPSLLSRLIKAERGLFPIWNFFHKYFGKGARELNGPQLFTLSTYPFLYIITILALFQLTGEFQVLRHCVQNVATFSHITLSALIKSTVVPSSPPAKIYPQTIAKSLQHIVQNHFFHRRRKVHAA